MLHVVEIRFAGKNFKEVISHCAARSGLTIWRSVTVSNENLTAALIRPVYRGLGMFPVHELNPSRPPCGFHER
jgi:hypothetical protein